MMKLTNIIDTLLAKGIPTAIARPPGFPHPVSPFKRCVFNRDTHLLVAPGEVAMVMRESGATAFAAGSYMKADLELGDDGGDEYVADVAFMTTTRPLSEIDLRMVVDLAPNRAGEPRRAQLNCRGLLLLKNPKKFASVLNETVSRTLAWVREEVAQKIKLDVREVFDESDEEQVNTRLAALLAQAGAPFGLAIELKAVAFDELESPKQLEITNASEPSVPVKREPVKGTLSDYIVRSAKNGGSNV